MNYFNDTVWKDDTFIEKWQYHGTEREEEAFTENTYWAFAAHSKGRVFLLMPYDKAPRADSLWWKVEWPEIRDGTQVSEVIWVDASPFLRGRHPPDPHSITRTWWKRGDAMPASFPSEAAEQVAISSPTASTTSSRIVNSQSTHDSSKHSSNKASGLRIGIGDASAPTGQSSLVPMTTPKAIRTSLPNTRKTTRKSSKKAGGFRPGFLNPVQTSRKVGL